MSEFSGIDARARAFVIAIGAILRRNRERRGWSHEDLCARLDGITVSMLEAIERGEGDIDPFQLEQICQALGIDRDTVIREAHAD